MDVRDITKCVLPGLCALALVFAAVPALAQAQAEGGQSGATATAGTEQATTGDTSDAGQSATGATGNGASGPATGDTAGQGTTPTGAESTDATGGVSSDQLQERNREGLDDTLTESEAFGDIDDTRQRADGDWWEQGADQGQDWWRQDAADQSQTLGSGFLEDQDTDNDWFFDYYEYDYHANQYDMGETDWSETEQLGDDYGDYYDWNDSESIGEMDDLGDGGWLDI